MKRLEFYTSATVPRLPDGSPNPQHPGFKAFVRLSTEIRWRRLGTYETREIAKAECIVEAHYLGAEPFEVH